MQKTPGGQQHVEKKTFPHQYFSISSMGEKIKVQLLYKAV